MIIATSDELAKRRWATYQTEHLKAAWMLREILVNRGYMRGSKQGFHWGLGFSVDGTNGLKTSSAANVELSDLGRDPLRLSSEQQAKFKSMMRYILPPSALSPAVASA